MPINATVGYAIAERKFHAAQNTEEKILALEEMLREAPKHKGAENMLAQLKSRLAKLKKEQEKEKQKKKGGRKSVSVKKEGHAQVVLLGPANVGRSSLLTILTNAKPKIAEFPFTTQHPEIGTLEYGGLKIQMVELPATAIHDAEMLSIARSSDLILLVVTSVNELREIIDSIQQRNINNKKIVVINKADLHHKDINFLLNLKNSIAVSAKTLQNIEQLKEMIFQNLGLIRVYTKEPGRKPDNEPVVMKKGSTIKDLAGKIRKDFVKRFEFAKVTGKSVKFAGQNCGLEYILEDGDMVELHIK